MSAIKRTLLMGILSLYLQCPSPPSHDTIEKKHSLELSIKSSPQDKKSKKNYFAVDSLWLSDLLIDYDYIKSNLLKTKIKIQNDFLTDKRVIKNFYEYGKNSKKGTCGELMQTLYEEINKKRPKYHCIRTCGLEPDYYFRDGCRHYFLLVSEKDILNRKEVVSDEVEISAIMDEYDPLIVDPSFRKVIRYSESRYTVRKMFNEDCIFLHSNSLKLDRYCSVPLGMDRDKIIYLKPNENMKIGIQKIREIPKYYEIDDFFLDSTIQNPKILKIINKFRSAEISPNQFYFL